MDRDNRSRSDKGDRSDYKSQRPMMHARRKKVCVFCEDHSGPIDYKDVAKLRKFISERSKILPRRVTGTCAKHQREVNIAIKRARHMALIPLYLNYFGWNSLSLGTALSKIPACFLHCTCAL